MEIIWSTKKELMMRLAGETWASIPRVFMLVFMVQELGLSGGRPFP